MLDINGITSLANCHMMIFITGLPFTSGSTYSTRLGPTNQAVLGCADFLPLSATIGKTAALLSSVLSFDKPLQDVMYVSCYPC